MKSTDRETVLMLDNAADRAQLRDIDMVKIGRRAINYLTKIAPRTEGFVPFFGGKIPLHGQPYLIHCPWDYGDGIGRILEALSFVRRMTGSDDGMDVQDGLIKKLCSLYASDGLTYREATPWSSRVSGAVELRSSALALVALIEDGNEHLEPMLASAVEGISRIFTSEQMAVASGVWDGEKWTGERYIGVEIGPGLFVIDALVRSYCATGNTRALEAADKIIEHYFFGPHALFADDGTFVFPGDVEPQVALEKQTIDYVPSLGHFHTRSCGTVGLARYGVVTKDERCLGLARRIHDHMMSYGTGFGWFPENLFTDGREVSEMCDTLDMIELQLLLAGAGQTDLYNHAERFAKNHVAATQFAPDELVLESVRETNGLVDETGQRRYTDVLDALSGGFVCVTYPDDVYTAYPGSRFDPEANYLIDISGCCSGSGAKAAYVVWERAVVEEKDAVRIDLALNRRHAAVDMHCEEDEALRITLHPRVDKPLLFRIPEGVGEQQIRVGSKEGPVHYQLTGEYIRIEPNGFRELKLDVPLVSREEICRVAGLDYRVRWSGSRTCSVDREDDSKPIRNPYCEWFGFQYK